MRIDLANPGHMLTNAYAISKSSANDPMVAFQKSTGPGSTTGKVANFTEAGKIISVAEKPSVSHLAWSRFAYDPDMSQKANINFGKWLSEQLFLCWLLSGKKRTRLSVELFQDMAMLCVLDTKKRIANGKARFTSDEICQHLGYKNADNANWRRTIRPHWEAMSEILTKLDTQIVSNVKRTLLDLRFGNDRHDTKLATVC